MAVMAVMATTPHTGACGATDEEPGGHVGGVNAGQDAVAPAHRRP